MTALTELIGESVISHNPDRKVIATSEFEGSGKVLGLYFSAHWCPPCRAFTPQLAQWYEKVKESSNGENFDIVFISSDRETAQFEEYFDLMPWCAVPYEHRELKNKTSKKFKVTGIPTLVLINAGTGELITTDGRSIVIDDPEGKDFPWTPKPVLELLSGILKTPSEEDTQWEDVHKANEYFGIYFSAHWCGPCRTFTPLLVKTYKKLKEDGKKFEIIFCSSDREKDAYEEYYATMPWFALPFGDGRKKSLSRAFDVSGIPTLIILDKQGELVNASGRAAIHKDPNGLEYPWKPKPVNLLSSFDAGDINDNAAIVWFTDGSDEGITIAKKSLELVAKECMEKPDPKILFLYTNPKEDKDITESLCSFASLTKNTPFLVLFDIPNNMQYTSDESDVTTETVREMVDGYKGKSLKGTRLK